MPFWKKTDKGGKKKPPKSAVPRTAQQSIPMQRMFEDGTCRVKPNYYTRTIQYQDINYQLAQQEDKTAIFEEWCSFLNFFDSSIKFELSFVNMATDSTEFEKSIRIPYQKDGFDDVRAEYSQMLRQQLAKGNNGLTKTKFITFGVEGESMAQVKPRLDHIQNDLLNNFHRLGVQAKPLNGVQRLKLMHDMFNMDGASKFHFDWKDLVKSGLSVKDAIAPTAFAFKNSRTFQMGGSFLRRQLSEHHGIRHQRPAFEGFSGHGFVPDRHHAHSECRSEPCYQDGQAHHHRTGPQQDRGAEKSHPCRV